MQVKQTELRGAYILEPRVFGDGRGWFMESWSEREFAAQGIRAHFVQDNHSFSAQKGTLRGLHYQLAPMSQAKLVRCLRGAMLDIIVDLRQGSPSYGKWLKAHLSAENKRQIFVPRGFAHGFITLTDDVEVFYKADNYYAPDMEGNIRYNDPEMQIDWEIEPQILSPKDEKAPFWRERKELNFVYKEAEA